MTLSPVCAYLTRPSLLDFRGAIAAVFFVGGCNFRCGFCHNPELIAASAQGLSWSALAAACRGFRDNWVDGAVITGGEPTLCPELGALVRFFKEHGFKVKLDTNGSHPDVLRELLPAVDYVAMDVKCPLEDYRELTGFAQPALIGESIQAIKQSGVPYEFRTTVIERYHSEERMLRLKPLVAGSSRYVLQPFVPRATVPDESFRGAARTTEGRLRELRELFVDAVGEVLC